MNKAEKLIALVLLVFAVGYNLWLYRLEPTATVDPNDNSFQFALVDRTNSVWDFSVRECSRNFLTFGICHFAFLSDHWVNNWAQGYNLPFYYSHIPQMVIVGTWRFMTLFTSSVSLFTYYHWVIYLLLCIFPLPVFIALRIIRLPWIAAGIGALLATHISTDGLYGLDPPSFLWRGYGLSSQLFAMVWLPLALAYGYRFYILYSTIPRKEGKPLYDELNIIFHLLYWRSGINFSQIASRASGNKPNGEKNTNRERVADQEKFHTTKQLRNAFWLGVIFTVATTAGHLGIGIITIISLGVLAFSHPLVTFLTQRPFREIRNTFIQSLFALMLLAGTSIFFLSYWIIPVLLNNNYHNVSFWDPVWKFNSYGWFEISKNLLNGALFDFGRKQYFTVLVILGAIRCLLHPEVRNLKSETRTYFPFALLFVFWFVLYFGRTTWGGLIDLIPGMKEFHLSRFIVGLHAAGFFLAPIGVLWLYELALIITRRLIPNIQNQVSANWIIGLLVYFFIGLFFLPPMYARTYEYNTHNDRLILQANENHRQVRSSELALFDAIRRQPPGRVFAGRGGWWGKDFRVAETPYYMNLSTYGVPTSLWLPETWSPNSDVEQYFSEDKEYTYDLFNLRYVAAPASQKAEAFWKPIEESTDWKLYEVATSGYFTTGTHAAIVATDKLSYANVVRLWIQSDYYGKKLFPQLYFGNLEDVKDSPLPRFGMLDEANYRTLDGSTYNLFAANPVYMGPEPDLKIVGKETVDSDMVFRTQVEVGANCSQCLVVLKQSFHPNWIVTVNGNQVKPFSVFPVFIGIPVTSPGTYDIVASYQPSRLKVTLLVIQSIAAVLLFLGYIKHSRTFRSS